MPDKKMKTSFQFVVTPLTAVHVGTGNQLSPMEYTIDENNRLQRFSAESIIQGLSARERRTFLELAGKADHLEIREFVAQRAGAGGAIYSLPVTTSLLALYREKRQDPRNQLLINEMAWELGDSRRPYIPGSSLKGAIRTAVLSGRAQRAVKEGKRARLEQTLQSGNPRNKSDSRFQKEVLRFNDAHDDPFRTLAIGDCPMRGTKIATAARLRIFKKKTDSIGDMSMTLLAELIRGELLNGDAEGTAEVNFDANLFPEEKTVKVDEVLKDCDRFFRNEFDDEYSKFYVNTTESDVKTGIEALKEAIGEILPAKGQFLLRVGRFSQVESVTVEDFRDPWNSKGYGATRTLAEFDEGCLPLGWVRVQIKKKNEGARSMRSQPKNQPDQLAAKRFVVKKRPE